MPSVKRRRHPHLPDFRALSELAPFDPINPMRQFGSGQVIREIAAVKKMGPGQKLVFLLLADQCFNKGYDWHSQRELAAMCGMSARQFRRHLARLRKLRFVHVAPEIGKQDTTWCLYHPVFANCSLLPQVNSVLGGRSEVSDGVGQNWPTHEFSMNSSMTSDGATRLKATSGRGPVEQNGRRFGEDAEPRESPAPDYRYRVVRPLPEPPFERTDNPPSSDAGNGESLVVVREARAFWYALEPGAKRNRYAQAVNVADRIQHFRNYLKDPHAEIARQAQHEISRALDELRGLGFSLHSNGGKQR
jgi:hypothetical protein